MCLPAGGCWLALSPQLYLRLLQCLQRGEELAGGVHSSVRASPHNPHHWWGACIHIQAPGTGEPESPASE